MPKRFPACLLCVLLSLLGGCGGGGGSAASAVGRAVFSLQWPVSRAIPAGANSVKITLAYGTNRPLSQTAARPQPTLAFENLQIVQYTATVESFASTDATGSALTTISFPVNVSASGTTTQTISADITLDHLTADYTAADVAPGETLAVMTHRFSVAPSICDAGRFRIRVKIRPSGW